MKTVFINLHPGILQGASVAFVAFLRPWGKDGASEAGNAPVAQLNQMIGGGLSSGKIVGFYIWKFTAKQCAMAQDHRGGLVMLQFVINGRGGVRPVHGANEQAVNLSR